MTEKPRRKRRIILIAILIILLTLVIFFIDSNIRLVTSEFELHYPNLPQEFDGFRIVVLSDLHGARFGRDNERLVRRVIEAEPDIIALAGDFIDEYNMPPIERQLEITDTLSSRLMEIAPVYFVTGNHDWASKELPRLLEILENNGVTVLRNNHVLLESGSQSIILAGTDDPNGPADMIRPREFVRNVREAEGDGFFIMLEHRNRNLQLYSELGVDLVLSGHSHGGIIRLPFTDGLIDSRIGLFPEHASGVNTIGDTSMVVSRGLGSWIIWMRLFNNPEVVVVELRVS
jgi:predicted MPP superfamily phosphohydrolase